ncbi:hypothetical protein CFN78_19395 [Amycolatopsis antarctica]|uniref:Uncharacterized protein n=1 Tax=Amycolatopsis antarctica TaxID=1854586 RepID=A0A263D0M4_9PSEU|nr:hypothetical protein [Amycolatopsis antarctica]OZM71678.1 hypothetical protein CFN78_19395 [Amycolatopsis antarctica]
MNHSGGVTTNTCVTIEGHSNFSLLVTGGQAELEVSGISNEYLFLLNENAIDELLAMLSTARSTLRTASDEDLDHGIRVTTTRA